MADRISKCPSRVALVLKGLVERNDPRAFYRGSWSRTFGVLLGLADRDWARPILGVWFLTDAGLDAYIEFGVWAVRHG